MSGKWHGKVGLYSVGLKAYWAQFPGLRDRLSGYGAFIADRLSAYGEVYNYGLVDCAEEGRKAGEYFKASDVDIIFCHSATYVTSDAVLPVHQICGAKTIVLNLQPGAHVNYNRTTTGEWLAYCGACPVPEISNAFERAGIEFTSISGLLGLRETPEISTADENTAERPEAVAAWAEIEDWCRAAAALRSLRGARFGFLGGNYSGMLDMYSDFTMLQAQAGIHVEIIEMDDLAALFFGITEDEIAGKLKEIDDMFLISGDSKSDPLAKKPTRDQLLHSAKVAAAQEKLVNKFRIDALAYYYHSTEGNVYEDIQSGFIVGHSLLTAKGIPCAGEADIKTALAMKICDILSTGGSFCEIVTADYSKGTILLGHDGPFHIEIAAEKPILRGMGLYHGKRGAGVSVEAKVRTGPVTMLGITQLRNGNLRFVVSEGESTDDEIMQVGNTQTHVRFGTDIDSYFTKWFAGAPTHHCAMSVGRNAKLFRKVAALLGCEAIEI
ncbi:MAG: L-fucose/L-arabinose isomerase family protein [Clostridiales Family XIII bacterium]|jgi:L-arabinose isomerase|nr:L-fucose/L-arabinose isomerase family protein [Clostridiales Family XIII bacterium]